MSKRRFDLVEAVIGSVGLVVVLVWIAVWIAVIWAIVTIVRHLT